ncbi:hypothetical protein [Actinomadura flavalba]|uniref:hypothetical protein n=1 Tax=Actinomadura flavalba TaxID=1120938 RepID=UPI00037BA434|nr:hypothetical protein [Actinomadura flavalba]
MTSHARRPPALVPADAAVPVPAVRSVRAVLGLLLVTVAGVPAAVLTLPDTVAGVLPRAAADLGLSADGHALLRATGLTLPALLLAVPLGALAARTWPAGRVLTGGLALLAAGVAAAPLAASVPVTAALRAAQGAGAGLVLSAVLALITAAATPRARTLLGAVWAGTLVAALLTAMPLALAAVPSTGASGPWQDALAPHPWPVLAALAAVPLLLGAGRPVLPPAARRRAERGQLVLPLVPTTGFAFLALLTGYGWSPGGRLTLAVLTLLALAGLAFAGGRDAITGSPHGCAIVLVSTGLLTYPVAAPAAGLLAEHGTGPAAAAFAAAGAAAFAGAAAGALLARPRVAVLAGHGLAAAALLLAATTPAPAVLPLLPLAFGVGAALAAALRDATPGAALFGLALCFPAVLTGQLLVQAFQLGALRAAAPAAQLAALTAGYRTWLLGAAAGAALLAVASRWAAQPGGDVPGDR